MNIKHVLIPGSLVCVLLFSGCGGSDNHHKKNNRIPEAANMNLVTQADLELTGTLVGTDADSDSLKFVTVSPPANGTLELNANGNFVYKPKADSIGTDEFKFSVSDAKSTSNTATVKITINPRVVAFDTYSRLAFAQQPGDQPLPINTRDVQQNVTDPAAYDDLLE